jgi:hypothetical protein
MGSGRGEADIMWTIFIILAVIFGVLAVALLGLVIALAILVPQEELDSIVLRPPQKLPRPY